MEADNMEAVDMFQITFISKSQTMFCGRRIWQQEQRPELVGKPRQWSTCLWLCRVLAAVSAVSTTVSTVAAVAAATVATAPPAAPTSKRSPSRSRGLEPELLRRLTGGHQCCLEQQAGGAGREERRLTRGQ